MAIDAHVAYVECREDGSGTLHLCDRIPNGSRGQSRLHFQTAPYEVTDPPGGESDAGRTVLVPTLRLAVGIHMAPAFFSGLLAGRAAGGVDADD